MNGVTLCEVARSAGAFERDKGSPKVVTMPHVGSCTRAKPAAVGGAGSQPRQADAVTNGSVARNMTGDPG